MHSGGQAPLSLGHTILTETQTLVNEATLTPCLGSTVPRRYSHPIWITPWVSKTSKFRCPKIYINLGYFANLNLGIFLLTLVKIY